MSDSAGYQSTSPESVTVSGAKNPPFLKRRLSVQIIVPSGVKKMDYKTGKEETSELAGQTISLQKYRIIASIVSFGGAQGIEASIQIYNLPQNLMRSLAGYGSGGVFSYRSLSDAEIAKGADTVLIEVYASGNTEATTNQSSNSADIEAAEQTAHLVFKGDLMTCTAEMDAVPDPFLSIQAYGSYSNKLAAADVISYKGAVSVSSVAQQIATLMNLSFEDGGVTTILYNLYLWGSLDQQLRDLALQGRFTYIVDRGALAIWPLGGSRNSSSPNLVTVSANNGLIGYPKFNGVGVEFKTIYKSSIRQGDRMKLQSSLPNATGEYTVYSINHHLSCELPGGPWETEIMANFLPNALGKAGV